MSTPPPAPSSGRRASTFGGASLASATRRASVLVAPPGLSDVPAAGIIPAAAGTAAPPSLRRGSVLAPGGSGFATAEEATAARRRGSVLNRRQSVLADPLSGGLQVVVLEELAAPGNFSIDSSQVTATKGTFIPGLSLPAPAALPARRTSRANIYFSAAGKQAAMAGLGLGNGPGGGGGKSAWRVAARKTLQSLRESPETPRARTPPTVPMLNLGALRSRPESAPKLVISVTDGPDRGGSAMVESADSPVLPRPPPQLRYLRTRQHLARILAAPAAELTPRAASLRGMLERGGGFAELAQHIAAELAQQGEEALAFEQSLEGPVPDPGSGVQIAWQEAVVRWRDPAVRAEADASLGRAPRSTWAPPTSATSSFTAPAAASAASRRESLSAASFGRRDSLNSSNADPRGPARPPEPMRVPSGPVRSRGLRAEDLRLARRLRVLAQAAVEARVPVSHMLAQRQAYLSAVQAVEESEARWRGAVRKQKQAAEEADRTAWLEKVVREKAARQQRAIDEAAALQAALRAAQEAEAAAAAAEAAAARERDKLEEARAFAATYGTLGATGGPGGDSAAHAALAVALERAARMRQLDELAVSRQLEMEERGRRNQALLAQITDEMEQIQANAAAKAQQAASSPLGGKRRGETLAERLARLSGRPAPPRAEEAKPAWHSRGEGWGKVGMWTDVQLSPPRSRSTTPQPTRPKSAKVMPHHPTPRWARVTPRYLERPTTQAPSRRAAAAAAAAPPPEPPPLDPAVARAAARLAELDGERSELALFSEMHNGRLALLVSTARASGWPGPPTHGLHCYPRLRQKLGLTRGGAERPQANGAKTAQRPSTLGQRLPPRAYTPRPSGRVTPVRSLPGTPRAASPQRAGSAGTNGGLRSARSAPDLFASPDGFVSDRPWRPERLFGLSRDRLPGGRSLTVEATEATTTASLSVGLLVGRHDELAPVSNRASRPSSRLLSYDLTSSVAFVRTEASTASAGLFLTAAFKVPGEACRPSTVPAAPSGGAFDAALGWSLGSTGGPNGGRPGTANGGRWGSGSLSGAGSPLPLRRPQQDPLLTLWPLGAQPLRAGSAQVAAQRGRSSRGGRAGSPQRPPSPPRPATVGGSSTRGDSTVSVPTALPPSPSKARRSVGFEAATTLPPAAPQQRASTAPGGATRTTGYRLTIPGRPGSPDSKVVRVQTSPRRGLMPTSASPRM